ncbi:uncharacterized protein F4807DRAFT_417928 [Annulohypoxylon truncatum]|uniref:uncharacterized protein n=1 Tax=Annulohypoxylon truncatum TaxID=327061 RepID=UPI0020078775|nr:uncharacterized protein F4807DRAFT_417928 [Annulohypoxylon truncatum]KAI1211519.1 hypothetical protein F4807DRAFT_417928 [Annulohypoxylon truncatum]
MMSSPVQILARNLQAIATGPSGDGANVFLLEEAEGNLLQELWVDNQPVIKTFVTSGAKENTPAVYLTNEAERYIFFLDNTNQLRCVTYDENDEEWDDAPFNDVFGGIEVYENTRLSGFSNPSGMMIVFETQPGQLATLVGRDGQWKVTGAVPAKVEPGAAHTTVDGPNKLDIFCFGHDSQILHLVQDHNSGSWDASVVENSRLEAPLARIAAFPKEDALTFDLVILLSNSQMIWIEAGGAKTDLGVVDGTKLIPPTAAECSLFLPPRYISQFANSGFVNTGYITYNNYYMGQPSQGIPAWGRF